MAMRQGYVSVAGSEHVHAETHKDLNKTAAGEPVTVTLILRRRQDGKNLQEVADFSAKTSGADKHTSHSEFASLYGADPKDLQQVSEFAKAHGLEVTEADSARRSVVLRGTADAVNKAFDVELHDYESPRGKYRSHAGDANLPHAIANLVEGITGLDSHKVPAVHYAKAPHGNASDPAATAPLTPQQVATLYNFPTGNGSGQTIGIYEMETSDGPPGYSLSDITKSIHGFGGGLKVPVPVDVSIDGVTNSGQSDGETGLDITVAGAIAQGAEIAVYFTGGTAQSIIHALQTMIHPAAGQPQPTILSISYGWGPDDKSADSFSKSEYHTLGQLFQDAANLSITVLVSSGDSGAEIASKTQAQTSYPATEPWVIACGGTTVGNIHGSKFDEYVWNDVGAGGPGATGGGISAHFPVPDYQASVDLPKRNHTEKAGRGIPDIAGNASENSGYPQFINGVSQPVGGTSAVAPLYAGLIALVNSNLGHQVGFINPFLYGLTNNAGVFNNIVGPPGPANNSLGGVTGYSATPGWNACTGLGSVNGTALQTALQAAAKASSALGKGMPVGSGKEVGVVA